MECPDKIKKYLKSFVNTFDKIESIWLFGSGLIIHTEKILTGSLVFTDTETFELIRSKPSFNKNNIDLLIVYNGNDFSEPWTKGQLLKHGKLTDWKWNQLSPIEAEYLSIKYIDEENWFKNVEGNFVSQTLKAFRIWTNT